MGWKSVQWVARVAERKKESDCAVTGRQTHWMRRHTLHEFHLSSVINFISDALNGISLLCLSLYHLFAMNTVFIICIQLIIFIIFILGPWSGKHGRKKPILFCQFGMLLNMVCILLLVQFHDVRAEFFVIPPFLEGLTGGFMAILMLCSSYICDVTNTKQRTFRISCVYISQAIGGILGTLLMAQIYRYFDNTVLFSVALGCLFLYSWIRIENRLPDQKEKESDEEENQCMQFIKFTGLTNMAQNFLVLKKRRPGYDIMKINIWLAAMLLQCVYLGDKVYLCSPL